MMEHRTYNSYNMGTRFTAIMQVCSRSHRICLDQMGDNAKVCMHCEEKWEDTTALSRYYTYVNDSWFSCRSFENKLVHSVTVEVLLGKDLRDEQLVLQFQDTEDISEIYTQMYGQYTYFYIRCLNECNFLFWRIKNCDKVTS